MAASIRVEIKDLLGNVEQKLARIALAARGPALDAAVKAAAKVVIDESKRRVPQPGYSGDKPGLKPLRDTIGHVVRKPRGDKRIAVVGPEYPAGAHGHLVEFGHQKVLWGTPTNERVPPHPFMRPSVDATEHMQSAAMDTVLRQAIDAEASKR
jgi:hypothetical protein